MSQVQMNLEMVLPLTGILAGSPNVKLIIGLTGSWWVILMVLQWGTKTNGYKMYS